MRRMVLPFLLFFLVGPNLFAQGIRLTEHSFDDTAGNLSCYLIETSSASYYLEKTGCGLSSLLDKDGNDWISFHPEIGSGAGGEYRGFPNAVHRQDGSFFHPMNCRTDSSATKIKFVGPERITIIGKSGNGTWQCRWDFYHSHCTFTMTKKPKDFKYWILYEGTPGGRYNDTDWWMTSAMCDKISMTIPHEYDIPAPEWIAFGDQRLDRCLFLLHHEDDNHIDRFYQMNKQMTVFGFGRKGIEKLISTVPQSFSIGFIESTKYAEIASFLNNLIMN